MGSWMMYLLLSLNGDPIIPYRRLDERRQPSMSKISTTTVRFRSILVLNQCRLSFLRSHF